MNVFKMIIGGIAAGSALVSLSACTTSKEHSFFPDAKRLQPEEAIDMSTFHKIDGTRYIYLPDLAPLFPDAAARKQVGGYAKLHCRLDADNYLHDCTVVEETPVGLGFGTSTEKVALRARIRPLKVNGLIVPHELVEFSLQWRLN
jgi:hypothetical protein